MVGFRGEPDDLQGKGTPLLFFSREEPRVHVHVQGQEGEAKFWLESSIELAVNYGLSQASLRLAQRLIQEREDEIRSAWETHFPG